MQYTRFKTNRGPFWQRGRVISKYTTKASPWRDQAECNGHCQRTMGGTPSCGWRASIRALPSITSAKAYLFLPRKPP